MWTLNFVNENPTELLKLAYSALEGLEDAGIKWMSPANIKNEYKKNKKSCSFIFSSFDGSTYEYLKNLKMKIYGPQLILDYLRNNESLLEWHVPLFSTALKGAIICFSAIDNCDRDILSEKVEMMHGTVIKDLTVTVNILVSTNVGTKKVRVAAEKGIPIVLKTWIDYLWSSSAISDPIDGCEKEIIDKYRIPVFHNLRICLSGMTALERSEAENIITKNGGEYCRDLTVGHCTHLVTKQGRGKKYYYAMKWRIQIVTCKWLADSIERGFCLDEEEYRISYEKTSLLVSTPNKDDYTKHFPCADQSAISETDHINETILTNNPNSDLMYGTCSAETVNMIPTKSATLSISSIDDIDFDNEMDEELVNNIESVQPMGAPTAAVMTAMESMTDLGSLEFLSEYLPNNENIEPAPESMATKINDKPDETIKAGGESTLPDEIKQDDNESLGVFGHCRFTLADLLTEEERKMAEKLISENGGTILTVFENATHIITPMISSTLSSIRSIATPKVTTWYLQTCVKNRSLLEQTNDFLFEPVWVDVEALTKPLAHTVLSFSGYPSDERKLLKSVASSLGASVQDKLARRAMESHGILATTHLVIGKPDRTKLPSCRSWGVPAVSKHWLGACAAAGRLVNTQSYEVADNDSSMMSTYTTNTAFSTSGTENTEVPTVPVDTTFKSPPALPLNIRNRHLDKARAADTEAHDISVGNLMSPIMRIAANDPLTAPRKINLAGLEALKTPEHFQPRRAGTSRARRNQQLDQSITSPDVRRALESRLKMFEREFGPTTKGNADKKLNMDTSLSDIEPRPVSHPLHAVVVYVAQSLHSQQIAMKNIIEALGGEFSWIYDSQVVTHVICSEVSESARCRDELLTASRAGKVLVNANWLHACEVEQRRVDESIYLVVPNSIVDLSLRKRKGSDDAGESSGSSCKRNGSEDAGERSSGSSCKRKGSDDAGESSGSSCKSAKMTESSMRWDYQDKLISRSRADDSQSTQISQHDECASEVAADSSDQKSTRPVIMLHSVGGGTSESYEIGIQRLGGELEQSDTNMSRVTHLICPEPGRNAKYLSAVAAGLWVLHTSFLDESIASGHWVDESRYEWGGPLTSQFLSAIPRKEGETVSAAALEVEASLAEAARRLRQQGGGLVFRDWRVCILDVPAKASKFAIIIEAGGGLVLPHETLPNPKDVTHFLVNKTYLAGMSDEVVKFPCYRVDLISYFLAARNEQECKKIVKKFLFSSKEVASLTKSGEGAKKNITAAPAPAATRTRRSKRI